LSGDDGRDDLVDRDAAVREAFRGSAGARRSAVQGQLGDQHQLVDGDAQRAVAVARAGGRCAECGGGVQDDGQRPPGANLAADRQRTPPSVAKIAAR
jgi:hypothetical protein